MPGQYVVRLGAARRRDRPSIALQSAFEPGVTRPFYFPAQNPDNASKNIGNLTSIDRTAFSGTVANGITQLTGSQYDSFNFTDTIVEPRGATMVFNNCRFYMSPYGFLTTTSIPGLVRNLNGANGSVTFNDCEFHWRGQRTFNDFSGRNAIFNRCVLTGGVDGPSDSAGGSAPQNFGIIRNDCWIGSLAYFRTPATPWEGHGSDTRTHNDSSQVATTLGNEWHNSTLIADASPFVGTGTPGFGSDAGNPYVPPNTNYIVTQAISEGYRSSDLGYYSDPAQSMDGVSRRIGTTGSWAAIMGNRNGGVVDHCYFDGGLATINLMDTNVTANWSIKKSVFWNGMVNGHGGNSATKGHAVLARTGLNGILDMPTTGADRNLWFDGTTVFPTFN